MKLYRKLHRSWRRFCAQCKAQDQIEKRNEARVAIREGCC